MKHSHFLKKAMVLTAIVFTSYAPFALAESGESVNAYRGGGNAYFDPSTVTTLSGTITKLFEDWEPRGHGNHTGEGYHFEFTTDNDTVYHLILGPSWYMADEGINLEVGDRLTVTGSIVEPYNNTYADNDYLIAVEILVGGQTIKIRDKDGYPLWRGGPNGRGGNIGPDGERYYDPDSGETLRGELTECLCFWSPYGHGNYTGSGMHYIFESNDGKVYYVMLGPWWFLEQNGIELEVGLKVKLTGSVVDPYFPDYDEYEYIIVTEMKVGSTIVQLRDKNGYPLWSGTGLHYYSPAYGEGKNSLLAGTVERVRTRTHGRNLDAGVEVIFRSGGNRYIAYLGPQYFCEQIGISLSKGDQVRIRGRVREQDVVVLRLQHNGEGYRFRGNRGNPLWANGAM